MLPVGEPASLEPSALRLYETAKSARGQLLATDSAGVQAGQVQEKCHAVQSTVIGFEATE